MHKQDRQCTYIVTLTQVRATVVANKYYIFWVWVCSLKYPAFKAHVPYCYLWLFWFHQISPLYLANGTIWDIRTDMMKLIITFCNFANAPKKKMEEESHKFHVTVTVSSVFPTFSRTVPATKTIGWRLKIDSRLGSEVLLFCGSSKPNLGLTRKISGPFKP